VLILSDSAGLSSSSRTAAVQIDMPGRKFFLELLSPRWGFVFLVLLFQGLTPLAICLRRFAAGVRDRRGGAF
jgi:hypothetical protein